MFVEGFSGLRAFFFKNLKRKLFFVWFILIVSVILISIGGSSSDRTVGVSVFFCGGCTFLFWNYREKFSRIFGFPMSPRKKFVLIGSLGAAWAECVFWFFEKLFGASGVAAHPNLILDLLITMPWYVLMVSLLYSVETRYHYSYYEILLLGGIYELGADGIVGQLFELNLGNILFVLLVIPEFVIVYSIIVLPPSYVLRKESDMPVVEEGDHKYRYGLLPLVGLIPFAVYVLLFLGILSAFA